jgi:hypothetical protein
MYKDAIFSAGQLAGDIVPAWLELGFKFGDKGAHTSRTIMLAELSTVLRQGSASATRADYAKAVVEENCLAACRTWKSDSEEKLRTGRNTALHHEPANSEAILIA